MDGWVDRVASRATCLSTSLPHLSLSLPWQELPSREREKEREREKQKLLEDVVDEIFDMVTPKPTPNPTPTPNQVWASCGTDARVLLWRAGQPTPLQECTPTLTHPNPL